MAQSPLPPPGWQGEAICQSLHNAQQGVFSHPVLRSLVTDNEHNVTQLGNIIIDYRVSARGYNVGFTTSCPSVFLMHGACCTETPAWLWPQSFHVSDVGRDGIDQVLKATGTSIAMHVIKTLTNAWATSTRYHADVERICSVGCHCYIVEDTSQSASCSDSLTHHLALQMSWCLLNAACRSPCAG